ncbi:MAG TPA: LamG domain-containing protein [Longimicrobium sp.]|nr:LamG domain-containing protein [Longimicrobium sp.]
MNRKTRSTWMILWLGIPAAALSGCDSAVSAPLTAEHQAPALTTAAACIAPPSGLVSWWAGDGNAHDLQDGNDGFRQNGAGFAPGMVGSAFSLDGSDDYVLVPHSANLQLTAFTLAAWINPFAATRIQQPIIAKSQAGGNWVSYMLRLQNGGRLSLIVENHAQNRTAHWQTVSTLPSNQWHHVTGTWQNVRGDHTDAKIYVDGVEQVLEMTHNRGYNSTFVPGYTTQPLLIGRDEFPTGHFAGLIDEVDVYDRVLTAAEIQAMVAAGSAGKCRPGDACDAALAAAQQQIAALTAQNATLTAQNTALTAENTTLAAQNAALTAQNADLTAQNAALTAQNAILQGQLSLFAAEVTRVQNDLRTAFGDSGFTIPGTSPAEQMSNLADAILALNNGRKSGIYTYLRNNP